MIISILGQGAWGTALASHVARAHDVRWWGRDRERGAKIAETRSNDSALPGITIPESIEVIPDLTDCIEACDWSVWATPVSSVHELARQISPRPDCGIVLACKGMDPERDLFPSQILEEVWGEERPCAVLSGPSFADDLARGHPAAAVMASGQLECAQQAATIFHHGAFRIYTSTDLTGVQLGGAVKNVLAIASGIASGLALGDSARAALITRGIHELMRLGEALAVSPVTLAGLSGLGDTVLSCSSAHSRNFKLGQLIGAGSGVEEAVRQIGQVAEGRYAARAIRRLGESFQLELPICVQVDEVLAGEVQAADAVASLLARPARVEAFDV